MCLYKFTLHSFAISTLLHQFSGFVHGLLAFAAKIKVEIKNSNDKLFFIFFFRISQWNLIKCKFFYFNFILYAFVYSLKIMWFKSYVVMFFFIFIESWDVFKKFLFNAQCYLILDKNKRFKFRNIIC